MPTDFERVVQEHRSRYPLMEPRDLVKLAYQSQFGPEHLIPSEEQVLERLREEWAQIDEESPARPPEDIGNGLCRFYLNQEDEKELAVQIVSKLFCLTAKNHHSGKNGLSDKLSVLEKLPVLGMKEWLEEYRAQGCPALRHSEVYRQAYRPHYRLLKKEYAAAFPVLMRAARLIQRRGRAVVAIDGRCGSGKSSLGELMGQVFSCNVFHMDDFYLPRAQRAENWMELPGGNMDLRRFKREVLTPSFAGGEVLYRPFDCGAGAFLSAVPVQPTPLTVIEGSYSHHPALEAHYDLTIFVTCEREERLRRLKVREGDYYPTFQKLWIPLEEQYLGQCGAEDRADIKFDTTSHV